MATLGALKSCHRLGVVQSPQCVLRKLQKFRVLLKTAEQLSRAHQPRKLCQHVHSCATVQSFRGFSSNTDDQENTRGHSEHSQRLQAMLDESDESSTKVKVDDLEFDGFTQDEISKLISERPVREHQDPEGTSVLLFPGQGSQFVGMSDEYLEYPNVKEMFEVASEILQYNIKGLCVNGPKEDLDQTIHCQPAVFLTSLAAVEKLKAEDPEAIENCVAAAGFSVGEFAALVFAGALPFEEAVCLIHIRAEAMQRASEKVKSGMLSVVGSPRAHYNYMCREAATYCRNNGIEGAVCTVANYLYPDARVLAGNVEALDFLQERSKEFGLRSTRRLPVSGAFHTTLMEPAVERFTDALKDAALEVPLINVHSNVNGKEYKNTKQMRQLLSKQLVKPVVWEQTMHEIYERPKGVPFPRTFEVGPGKQLGTILKRVNVKAFQRYGKVKERCVE